MAISEWYPARGQTHTTGNWHVFIRLLTNVELPERSECSCEAHGKSSIEIIVKTIHRFVNIPIEESEKCYAVKRGKSSSKNAHFFQFCVRCVLTQNLTQR